MGFLKGSPILVCAANRHCSQWARIYLKYCLCNAKDGVSLSLGLASVVSWGVAEVPQIITNYKEKSTEGLSIAFLMTWIIGDIFNLIGCKLEPATLPTQFYMALLYTATTMLLTGQTVYYGHIYHWLKANKCHKFHEDERRKKEKNAEGPNHEDDFKARDDLENVSKNVSNEGFQFPSSPIPVAASALPHYSSVGRDFHYMSARSLSKTPKPTAWSYLAHTCDLGQTPPSAAHGQPSTREPLLGGFVSAQSAPPLKIKNMLCVVSSAVFLLGCLDLHLSNNKRYGSPPHEMVFILGRKLLQMDNDSQSSSSHGVSNTGIGTFFGWAMATIYMGGRLPQICLNIRRGNVEGLNPLMFGFALVGNATYVASILVSSMDWCKIRPNLPWLVDAGGCVLLDSFILSQFIYFQYQIPKASENNHGDYVPAHSSS